MKLLLIEDDSALRKNIRQFLSADGTLVEAAPDYTSADEKIALYEYDCILVDLNLPGGNGMELVRKIKMKYPSTGVIIISARNSIDDKISGLDTGADDYMPKPFDLSELNARIKSLHRRLHQKGEEKIISGSLEIVPKSQMIFHAGSSISLTPKEYELLIYFIENTGRVLTREAIAEKLWGDDIGLSGSYDFIYSHIKNLRKKLADHGVEDCIQAVYGTGYRYKPA